MQDAKTANAQEIVNSGWPTERLAGFALTYSHRGDGRAYRRNVWEIIGTTQDEAREYYDQLAKEDPEALRWEAAGALAECGWDTHSINFRNS